MSNMRTIKVSELTGAVLDWAVAHAGGGGNFPESFINGHAIGRFNYSTDWAQGGPIIERECIGVGFGVGINSDQWEAGYITPTETGATPLIAAMRCYVANELGDTVEVPEGLIYDNDYHSIHH